MPKIKLALLSGGISGEREVSKTTGDEIARALDTAKYIVYRYDPKTDMRKFLNDALDGKFHLVFPALHGPYGEDGRLQGMLDMLGVPYVFSGCLASALAMNKHKSKLTAREAGLNTAEHILLRQDDEPDLKATTAALGMPIVVKPLELGSSVGMSIARQTNDLERGITDAFAHGDEVMLERYIKGRELSVAVMGRGKSARALPVIEIKPAVSDWFDYRAKYESGGSEEICPADIPADITERVRDLARRAFRAIGCKDLARVDFIWSDEDEKLYFLEINTIPGMTPTSLVPQEAGADGMSFGEFLDELIGYNIQ